MIREIIKDTEVLSQKCEKVTDIRVAREIIEDLIDTATHNNETNEKQCCGLAANQIGINARVVIVQMQNGKFEAFINPIIVDHSNATIKSTEGCMSLDGERTVDRYKSIVVMAQNIAGKYSRRTFNGFTAIALQHEIDHTNGVLI